NLLGFTFICGKTHAGKFQVKRKSRRDRMLAKLRMVKEEMRGRMHQPIAVQGKRLLQLPRGADEQSSARGIPDRDRQKLASGAHPTRRADDRPKVGAVCGKAARTDLCGGREITRVPTATASWPFGSWRMKTVSPLADLPLWPTAR